VLPSHGTARPGKRSFYTNRRTSFVLKTQNTAFVIARYIPYGRRVEFATNFFVLLPSSFFPSDRGTRYVPVTLSVVLIPPVVRDGRRALTIVRSVPHLAKFRSRALLRSYPLYAFPSYTGESTYAIVVVVAL